VSHRGFYGYFEDMMLSLKFSKVGFHRHTSVSMKHCSAQMALDDAASEAVIDPNQRRCDDLEVRSQNIGLVLADE
jgi:hypothetical protein